MYTPGTLIRMLREKKGMKQKDLADILKVTPTYLSLIEKSKKEGSLTFYKEAAKIFNIPVWLLLWNDFELSENPTSDDIKIKKHIDKIIPELRSVLMKKII